MGTRKKNSVTKSSDVSKQASDAVAILTQLNGDLPIDDAMPPKEVAAAQASNRVPLEAISIASTVLNESPDEFSKFDAEGAQTAVVYEQAMAPVAQAAHVLAARIEKSILKRRSTAATQTLALYAVLKGTARLPASETTRTQVKQLAALLTTRRKSRAADVTQKETLQVTKVLKSQRRAALAQAEVATATTKATLAAAVAATQVAANAEVIPQAPAPAKSQVVVTPNATSTSTTPVGSSTASLSN